MLTNISLYLSELLEVPINQFFQAFGFLQFQYLLFFVHTYMPTRASFYYTVI